ESTATIKLVNLATKRDSVFMASSSGWGLQQTPFWREDAVLAHPFWLRLRRVRWVAEVGADRDPSARHLVLRPQEQASGAEYDLEALVGRKASLSCDGGKPHPCQLALAPESQDDPVRPAHSGRRGSPNPAKWSTEGLPNWRTGRFGLSVIPAPGTAGRRADA